MTKNHEQKKQELLKRFENKKTNFLTTLFALVKDVQEDLNSLSIQHREVEADETETKKVEAKTEEATKK